MSPKYDFAMFFLIVVCMFYMSVNFNLNILSDMHKESVGLDIPELVSVLDLGMTSDAKPLDTNHSEELLTKTEKRYGKDLIYTSDVFDVVDLYVSDSINYNVVLSKSGKKFTIESKGLYDYVSGEDKVNLGCIVDEATNIIHDVYFGDKVSKQ